MLGIAVLLALEVLEELRSCIAIRIKAGAIAITGTDQGVDGREPRRRARS